MARAAEPLVRARYTPPGAVAKAFMLSPAFVRGIMGPFGSGKSTACVMEIIRRAQQQAPGPDGKRRTRWVAVRNTYPELRTTTIPTWQQWIPPAAGRWIDEGPPRHLIKRGDIDLEVLFLSLDRPQDVRDVLGLEITGAWLNEVRELPRSVVDAITGRVAQARYPPAALGGASWSGVLMDTNPPDADHWYYKLAEEVHPDGWAFFRQPGGLSPGAENLQWLGQDAASLELPESDPIRLERGRETYRKMSAGKSRDWVSVYVDGEYGFVQDGRPVWPEYVDSTHCMPCLPDARLPLHVGLDFGLTPAATFGQRSPSGRWAIVGELATDDMGIERFGELLAREIRSRFAGFELAAITGDPAGDIRGQGDERTAFDILRAAGIRAQPSPDASNDFTRRREAVAHYLRRLDGGLPSFMIDPSCRMLRKGLAGAYKFKRVQVIGAERYQDKPDKTIHSHVCEALQYMFLGAGEHRETIRRQDRPAGHARPSIAIVDYEPFA